MGKWFKFGNKKMMTAKQLNAKKKELEQLEREIDQRQAEIDLKQREVALKKQNYALQHQRRIAIMHGVKGGLSSAGKALESGAIKVSKSKSVKKFWRSI